jgi:predicted Zn-dependent protease
MRNAMMNRRQFVGLSAASAAALASGCATNPVSGRTQLMLVSESSELDVDRRWAPHQFSADYGAVQDRDLGAYVSDVGLKLAKATHRPALPYNFRALNAVIVNAYTFPAGSVGVARGLLLALGDEAQLAAVLGHELGHVSARHTGARMTKAMVAMWVVTGVAAYVQAEREKYADLAAGLGSAGAQMLLARYSRDNEREADALGMEYAARCGYNPRGMVDLMDAFEKLQQSRPDTVELLFATHPLTDERHQTALAALSSKYAQASGLATGRERYMDRTARLRSLRGAIESLQLGENAMKTQKPAQAEPHLARALRQAPGDYAALLMMSKCLLALQKTADAERCAEDAKAAYPGEPQAHHVAGIAKMGGRKFDAALQEFAAYEKRLPGNPNSSFFQGYCDENMGKRSDAADQYERYLQAAPSGEYAAHARQRLTEWGRIRPQGAR